MQLYTLGVAMERELKVEWVWEPRLPRGYVTLLGARGGTGKSGFALWLSNEIAAKGKNILYVDAENTLKHMAERAKNWKLAYYERIKFFGEEDAYQNLESGFPGFAEISKIVRDNSYDMIVIDSLTAIAHTSNLKEERDASFLMKELRDLARIANSALLLLCHTKKPILLADSLITADDIAGSHALVDMARSVLLMTKEDKDPALKCIRHGKYNFSAPALDLWFRMDEYGVSELREVEPEANAQIIEAGTKSAVFNDCALAAAREGCTKREIRKRVKQLGATEVEATRTIQYLQAHGYTVN